MALLHRRGWAAEAHGESRWYEPIAPYWQRFAAHGGFPSPDELSALYRERVRGLPGLPAPAARLAFVPAESKKRRRGEPVRLASLYEGSIVELGEVPTRPNDWHDFFNVLSFIAFPRAKWALHHRQYGLWTRRIDAHTTRLPGARTREQDALTLFDEGGIALLVRAPEAAMLRDDSPGLEHEAQRLYRAGCAWPVPFGHALYEHLVEGLPCPLGTLHVVPLPDGAEQPAARLAALDRALARDFADPTCFTQPSPARGLSLQACEALAP